MCADATAISVASHTKNFKPGFSLLNLTILVLMHAYSWWKVMSVEQPEYVVTVVDPVGAIVGELWNGDFIFVLHVV